MTWVVVGGEGRSIQVYWVVIGAGVCGEVSYETCTLILVLKYEENATTMKVLYCIPLIDIRNILRQNHRAFVNTMV
jgi:hypothetical protein